MQNNTFLQPKQRFHFEVILFQFQITHNGVRFAHIGENKLIIQAVNTPARQKIIAISISRTKEENYDQKSNAVYWQSTRILSDQQPKYTFAVRWVLSADVVNIDCNVPNQYKQNGIQIEQEIRVLK